MKHRNPLPLICLLNLLCLAGLNAQTKTPQKDLQEYKKIKKVEFDLCYDISVPGKTSKITLTVLLPQTLPRRQKIFSIKYSPEPMRCFSCEGNDYAHFEFIEPPKELQVKINVRADLFRYDLSIARKKKKMRPPDDFDPNDFLKHEKHIEKDHPLIKEIARKLKGNAQEGLVKDIHDYVVNHMGYGGYNRKSIGAAEAIQLREGDCSEYTDLFVALCRAEGIPSRVVSGYTVAAEITPKHAWAEVYFKKYGWVPFDPTWADKENSSAREFHYLKSSYVYFTHIRSDPVLDNGHYYAYWYWGDKIEVEDTIEFK